MDWPAPLIKELARRRCVPFIGAGVSRNSVGAADARPPLWHDFIVDALERLDAPTKREAKRFVKKDDLLTAAQIAKQKIGRADWHDLLEDKFSAPNYQPATIHEHLFQLDAPIVCSTNLDKIYENYVVANYAGACIAKNYSDNDIARYVRGDVATRLILKVHGSIDALDKAVFTRSEYADAWNRHSHFYNLFGAIVLTNTILFLGYSMSDPDIQLILENSARLFTSSRAHYLVTPSKPSAVIREFYETNYNIKIVTYDSKDNHSQLSSGLAELVAQVTAKRQELANAQTW